MEVVDEDGQLRWHQPSGEDRPFARPAMANDAVYVTGVEGTVTAYEHASGDRRWRTTVGGGGRTFGAVPIVTDGAVHVNRIDGSDVVVHALDWTTGDQHWTLTRPGNRGAGPIPAGGRYLFTTSPETSTPEPNSAQTPVTDVTGTLWAFVQ